MTPAPDTGVRSELPVRDLQPDLFMLDEGDGAHAVPLHFEEPVVAARRLVGERRLHRARCRRHLGWLGAPFRLAEVDGYVFFYAALLGRLGAAASSGGLPRASPAGCSPRRDRPRPPSCASSCAPADSARSPPGCGRRARCTHAPPRPSPATANRSRFLMSSHSLPLPRPFMWTSAKSPLSFSPCRRNLRSPRAICSAPGCRPAVRTCRGPTASRCRRRSFPPGCCLRNSP